MFAPMFAPDEPDDGNAAAAGYGTSDYSNNYLSDFGGDCPTPEQVCISWRTRNGERTCRTYGPAPIGVVEAQTRSCKYRSATVSTNFEGSAVGPNQSCTTPAITPLSSDRVQLLAEIDKLVASGNTNISEGAAWAWRVLSPTAPFMEGRSYNDRSNKKIMIVMTDGDNMFATRPTHNASVYAAYGYGAQNRLSSTYSSAAFNAGLNSKTLSVCGNAKEEGITVYTVAFGTDISTTGLQLLEDCATSERKITVGLDKSVLVDVPEDLSNVLVSNPEIVDAVVQTSRQIYLLAKAVGEANAFLVAPDGRRIAILEITVNRDLTALNDTIARLLPGSKVRAEMMGDTVVLGGSVMNPVDANRAADLASRMVKSKDKVVNMLSTDAKEQVLLKVQVAEMNRDALRRIGVDMPGAIVQAGNFTFTKVIQNTFPVTGGLVPGALATAVGLPPLAAAGSALQSTWQSGGDSVTAMIQALERAGVMRTLAEPTLTAMSGETAKFLAGGEFPIPVAQDNNAITIEWKEFGVNVAFKPVVLAEGRISLTISAEVSELSTDGAVSVGSISVPGLKVRRAETTLELPSGATLAMAGLLSDETRQSVEGTPALKNLPVLGALFRSNDYRRRETELVILVSPYIATHSSPAEMARPIDGFAAESELKELFFGHINRVYGTGSDPANHRYRGDYGYIIEYPGVKG